MGFRARNPSCLVPPCLLPVKYQSRPKIAPAPRSSNPYLLILRREGHTALARREYRKSGDRAEFRPSQLRHDRLSHPGQSLPWHAGFRPHPCEGVPDGRCGGFFKPKRIDWSRPRPSFSSVRSARHSPRQPSHFFATREALIRPNPRAITSLHFGSLIP